MAHSLPTTFLFSLGSVSLLTHCIFHCLPTTFFILFGGYFTFLILGIFHSSTADFSILTDCIFHYPFGGVFQSLPFAFSFLWGGISFLTYCIFHSSLAHFPFLKHCIFHFPWGYFTPYPLHVSFLLYMSVNINTERLQKITDKQQKSNIDYNVD